MGKITKEWSNSLSGFQSEEDVVEFIFERLNTSDFEDSFVVVGNNRDCLLYTSDAADE